MLSLASDSIPLLSSEHEKNPPIHVLLDRLARARQ